METLKLLDEATANANGESFEWTGTGEGTLHIFGTFDTCTVTIQGSLDGGETWTAPAASAYTAATITSFNMGRGLVRAVLSSVGASTSVSCYLSAPDRA